MERIAALPKNQLSFAIDTVFRQVKQNKKGTPKFDPYDKNALATLLKRFEDEYVPKDLSKPDKTRLKLLSLYLQMPYSDSPDQESLSGVIKKEELNLFKTEQDLEEARLVLEKNFVKTNTEYVRRAPEDFISWVADYTIKNKLFEDAETGEIDLDQLSATLDKWAGAISNLFNKYGLGESRRQEDVKKSMEQFCLSKIDDKSNEAAFREKFGMPHTIEREQEPKMKTPEQEKKFVELGEALFVHKYKDLKKALDKCGAQLVNELSGKEIKDLGQLLVFIENGYSASTLEYDIDTSKNVSEHERLLASFEPRLMYLFLYCSKRLPQFKELDDFQKKLLTFTVAHHVGSHDFVDSYKYSAAEEKKYSVNDDPDYDEGMARPVSDPVAELIKKNKINPSDRFIFSEPFSEERTLAIYRNFLDKEYYKENVAISLIGGESDENYQEREHLFLRHLALKWQSLNLLQILDEISSFSSKGVSIQAIMGKNPRQCGYFVSKLLEAMKQNALEEVSSKDLLICSNWIVNPFLKNAFKRYVRDRDWGDASFEERLGLIFPALGEEGVSDVKTRMAFLEDDVQTKEQFAAVKGKMKLSLEDLSTEGSTAGGIAVLTSNMSLRFHNVNEFLHPMLKSGKGDRELKEVLYRLACELRPSITSDEESMFKEERKWVTDSVSAAQDTLRSLYTLDDTGRQLLLRFLLTSEGGAIIDKSKRKEFFKFMFNEWVEQDDDQKDILQLLQNVQEVLGDIDEWQLLYFVFQSVLQEKIAVPPNKEKDVPWTDIYDVLYDFEKTGLDEDQSLKLMSKSRWRAIPVAAKKKPHNYFEEYRFYSEGQLHELMDQKGYLEVPEQKGMKPLSFIKDAVSKIGSPGVRFLQLLPQFIELSPEYQDEFSDVYDSVQGQSKMAALSLLEREWEGCWDTVTRVGERVGGGSIVTVYRCETVEGETEVLKVRNPNIKFHLDETFRFAKMVIDQLAAKNGGAYSAAGETLEDIKEWIEGDINFKDFLRMDKEFKEKHHGFQVEGGRYSIYVPESKGPESEYFVREELIEGRTLTQWDDLEKEGHNMKEVVHLLLQNYIQQIMDGQVHSDVHIGNFMVTKDDKVAILDRNFYLDLSDEEKGLIFSLVNPMSPSDEKISLLEGYLGGGNEVGNEVRQDIKKMVEAAGAQQWSEVTSSIVKIKQQGVKIPVKLTLLLKNFNSLQTMGRKAGFEDLTGVFMYSPE